MTYHFTTIITQEDKWFVARCVELGVVSQGKTIELAKSNLQEAVELYLEDEPNPQRYMLKSKPVISTLEILHG